MCVVGSSHQKTYRLWPRVVEHVWVDVDGLALDLVCPTSVIPYATDGSSDVSPCQGNGLSVVQGLDGGKEVGILLQEISQLQEHDTPLLWRCLSPLALECFPGRGDGKVDIYLGGLADGADDLFGGRVDDLDLLLILALDPFIVDEPDKSIN